MAESFKLPGSSYDELIKIIKAYATSKVGFPMSLETVAQTAKMDKTIVSRNNGFLMQLAFISEGNKKAPTQLGSDLGRAYNYNINEQIVRIWRNAVETDEFLNRMLSAIRIRNGIEKSEFVNHILYSSGSSTNNSTRTGANTIIEIYKVAQLVAEDDGKITALDIENTVQSLDDIIPQPNSTLPSITSVAAPIQVSTSSHSTVNININISVSVDDLEALPEKIKLLIDSINEKS